MKCLSYVLLLFAFSIGAFGGELTEGFTKPIGITSEADLIRLQRRYVPGRLDNSFDTTELKQQFLGRVNEDPIATTAMEIFLDCMFWHFVDYCKDHLYEMTEANRQLIRELLILLAPQLDIGNYTEKVVSIIGDPKLVTSGYFQHRAWVHGLFFCGAVECGRRGYSWILIETCANACTQLRILAYDLSWPEYEQFNSTHVRYVAYNGRRTEDCLPLAFTTVWPNLESRVIPA
ncbi:MAG: hypothetical protein LBI20_00380 [Holosporales bacterium]|jgi:hypothetical protein|nr:hypothetical protein [Holosporales bacterium]